MRVLLVFSSSELGGAERSLTRMALSGDGKVKYDLATLDGCGPWIDWVRDQGAKPLVLGVRRGDDHGRFGAKAVLRLVQHTRRERYEIIYVIGLRASLWLRLMRPWLRGAKLVHGIRWNPNSRSRVDWGLRVIERTLGGLIDLFICNSRIAANSLQRRAWVSNGKIRVIYNGVDQVPARGVSGVSVEPHVLVLANVSPRKGHSKFLDVAAAVRDRVPQVRFFFVGRDNTGGRLANEIAGHGLDGAIALTGFQEDIQIWLAKARLLVLPSLWGEGCPTSILEGFAYGLPVVAYSIDGIPELIESGVDGYVVPAHDTAMMADAIVRLLENPQLAESMGAAGREKVKRRYTLSYCANEHAKVFRTLGAA